MDLPMLLLSGAVAGTLAVLFGIGGGIIIVPISIGATVAHKLPDQLLRRLFAVFLFILAGRMSFNLF